MKYIDVSQHQGTIDWEKVRGHIDGVMIRAGYGRGNVDVQFHRNASECNRLGISCGAYWFSYAYTEKMAKDEAKHLIAAVAAYEMELPLAYDWEGDSVAHAKNNGVTPTAALAKGMSNAFCQLIEAEGYWCMLYTNPSFIAQYFGELAGGRYDLWLAQWPTLVDVHKPPRKCGIWQWGTSMVPGINGMVDSNESYKDYAKFLRENKFNKLKPEPWYEATMRWGKEQGICDGTRPNDPATRAEVVQMLKNMLEGKQND